MNELLKRIFWKLPISKELKCRIGNKRYERIIKKEEVKDQKGSFTVIHDSRAVLEYSKYLLGQYGRRSEFFKPFSSLPGLEQEVHIAAYYLTQYHPNPQNDEWWGRGTTEWNNVNQAQPQYAGHYQPRRPGELGYYDLRLKENMQRQIELAKNYGVDIFCFYYYWFDGENLLERPLNMFLKNKDMDIHFCYCWANENWTKRFSGTDAGVLMGITHTKENYEQFIQAVLPDMKDERYYRIKGRPVLSIYRPSLIPDTEEVLKHWRQRAKEELGADIYLIAVQERDTSINWCAEGFDAETEFQPKQIQHQCKEITKRMKPIRGDFSGNIYDYEDMVRNQRYVLSGNQKKKVYPAVMPMWDNTARRNFRGTIFHGSTPELYKIWLADVIKRLRLRKDLDDRLLFVNAWNEWGEGTYLEPDYYFGYAYLQATREALEGK
ncbi:glycosyltransferase WbsX family protein [Anaerocolumna jejuensis]|uniref:glycosyltransferase WbsX family protein n=1 Tax=Anaerocolumna jejuensis TaxID=259063 RepID=UPI003F7C5ABC